MVVAICAKKVRRDPHRPSLHFLRTLFRTSIPCQFCCHFTFRMVSNDIIWSTFDAHFLLVVRALCRGINISSTEARHSSSLVAGYPISTSCSVVLLRAYNALLRGTNLWIKSQEDYFTLIHLLRLIHPYTPLPLSQPPLRKHIFVPIRIDFFITCIPAYPLHNFSASSLARTYLYLQHTFLSLSRPSPQA